MRFSIFSLIAIVSDSYDAARASGKALYYRAHLSLVSETATIASRCIPRRLLPTSDEAWIAKCLLAALAEREEDRGRIVEITRRTRAAVDAATAAGSGETDDAAPPSIGKQGKILSDHV